MEKERERVKRLSLFGALCFSFGATLAHSDAEEAFVFGRYAHFLLCSALNSDTGASQEAP